MPGVPRWRCGLINLLMRVRYTGYYMQSKVALKTSLFIVALVLGISTLSGAALTLKARDDLERDTAARRSEIAQLDQTLERLEQEKAYNEAAKKAEQLARNIEKKQKEEATAKAAREAAQNVNVPTGGINDRCLKPNAHSDPTRIDVIVNKKHCIQPLTFTPNTTALSCAGAGSAVIASSAVDDFKALCDAAKAAGVPLGITSSYRSYQTQVTTYNYWVAQGGQAAADRYSARPGYSEHQTGLSVDFSAGNSSLDNFTGTAQQKWMAKNAYKYGWIQRYTTSNSATTGYNAESWHYRYIGRSAAASYVAGGTGSLEAFWGISGGTY